MIGDLRDKLRNWGRYCRQDSGGPDSSCRNTLYDMMVYRDDDGYGEVTELTVVVAQPVETHGEQEDIDEGEAKWLDGHISALLQNHRAVLNVRYVLGLPCKTPEAHDRLAMAVWALQEAITPAARAYG